MQDTKQFLNFVKTKYCSILLGHHLDDMIETFCMRIIKSSRIDGLCPMVYNRKLFDLNLIRPFLHISKKEMYSYADLNKVKFFERSN